MAKAKAKKISKKATHGKRATAHVKAAAKSVRAKATAHAKHVAKSVRAAAKRAKAVVKRVERVVKAAAEPKWLASGMAYVNLYFTVRDPRAAADFYEKAFGLVKRNAMPGPDGNYVHVEMTWHGQAVMFGPADPNMKTKTPNELGGSPFNFYLYCEDVDALTARARAAGATVVMEPHDEFWGDRISGILDPDGHRWTFGTHVREVDFSQMTPPEPAGAATADANAVTKTGSGNDDTTHAG